SAEMKKVGMTQKAQNYELVFENEPLMIQVDPLITTAAGISVAIPALIFYRYFNRRVDELVLTMEQEAARLVELVHGDREAESSQ
ncbi:MAG: MotA/TolQ/ExbB proton channel family protein, partial [Gammaproteobacteria bacterium]